MENLGNMIILLLIRDETRKGLELITLETEA